MGNTHLNLSSLMSFGIFVHICQDNIYLGRKPPYVCVHYQKRLTKIPEYAKVINSQKYGIFLF